jgi:hypothetical protein
MEPPAFGLRCPAKQWRCKRCWFILGCALGGVLHRHSGITDRGSFSCEAEFGCRNNPTKSVSG